MKNYTIIKEVQDNKEIASNHLRYGKHGDFVEVGNKKAIRLYNGTDTLPTCYLYENGTFYKEEDFFSKAIDFLFPNK